MSTRTDRQTDPKLNEKHAKMLKALMMRPENRKCADCRKKVICKQINADPRWAPWNLGILICIRCSGIHRSLGTHISKVKSVDLDTWTPEQVENMLKWGNAKANLYWEHTWSGEPPENTIEQWIRAKYERKQYSMKGPVPDPDSLGDGVPTPASVSKAPPANFAAFGNRSGSTDINPKQDTIFAAFQSAPAQNPVPRNSQTATEQLFAAFESAPTPPTPTHQALKTDIMSLFATIPPTTAANTSFNQSNSLNSQFGYAIPPVNQQPLGMPITSLHQQSFSTQQPLSMSSGAQQFFSMSSGAQQPFSMSSGVQQQFSTSAMSFGAPQSVSMPFVMSSGNQQPSAMSTVNQQPFTMGGLSNKAAFSMPSNNENSHINSLFQPIHQSTNISESLSQTPLHWPGQTPTHSPANSTVPQRTNGNSAPVARASIVSPVFASLAPDMTANMWDVATTSAPAKTAAANSLIVQDDWSGFQ